MRNVYDDNDNDDSLNYPSSCSARQHNPKIFFVTKEKIIICAVVVDQEINNISFSVFFVVKQIIHVSINDRSNKRTMNNQRNMMISCVRVCEHRSQ